VIGRVSFGQQGFFVLGAYAAGLATALYGAPLLAGIAVGGAAAALAGAAFAWSMAHRGGLAFAAGTLAFGELVRVGLLGLHLQTRVGSDLVGPAGAEGFRGIRGLFTGGIPVSVYVIVMWGALAVTVIALGAFLRSRWGKALRMIGEDEDAAATLGVRVDRVKRATIAGAAGLAGVGGGLFAHYATYVEPGHADVMLGVHSLVYGLLGGLGTPIGPVIGVTLDVGLLESFRFLAGYRMIIFGALVVMLLAVRPRGLLDEAFLNRLARRLRRDAP